MSHGAPGRRARLLAGFGLIWLAGHFLCTAVYLNPVSVVGLAWAGPVSAYLEPLFRQRWSLFAPDPPLVDRRLDYQCERDGERGPWRSRSDALLASHARTRIGPAGRLRRLETAAIVATLGTRDPLLDALLRAQDQADPDQRERVEALLVERVAAQLGARAISYRLIFGYCREELGAAADRVRYRVVTRELPAFSRRHAPRERGGRALTFPWLSREGLATLDLRGRELIDAHAEQARAD